MTGVRTCAVFCFEAATGNVVWSKNIAIKAEVRVPGWGFGGSPLVHGDLLILNLGEAGTAVQKGTGELVWTSADSDAGYTTPLPVLRDGRWIAIACEDSEQWASLAELIGHQEWTEPDSPYDEPAARLRDADLLDAAVTEWTRSQSHVELMGLLRSRGVMAAAGLNGADFREAAFEVVVTAGQDHAQRQNQSKGHGETSKFECRASSGRPGTIGDGRWVRSGHGGPRPP